MVVNNGTDDAPSRELASQYGARYVYVSEPGLSRARNAAAHASSSDIVAYLDDDSTCDPQWLDRLVQEFQDPKVIAVTGRVDPIQGDNEAERLWVELTQPESDRARRASVDNQSDQWFEKTNFGGVGIGCNMALRRSAWSEWPGFDERLGRGATIDASEEHFAFFTLVSRGFRVVYTPAAVVYHAAPASVDELRKRYVMDLSAATAYVSLLFVEFPQHRRQVLKFILARLKKSPRDWRERRPPPRRIIPKWRAFLALLYGPVLYLKTRLSRSN